MDRKTLSGLYNEKFDPYYDGGFWVRCKQCKADLTEVFDDGEAYEHFFQVKRKFLPTMVKGNHPRLLLLELDIFMAIKLFCAQCNTHVGERIEYNGMVQDLNGHEFIKRSAAEEA